MNMHVHEPRQHELIAKVDQCDVTLKLGRLRKAAADFDDLAVRDDDRLIARSRLTRYGQQFTCMNDRRIGECFWSSREQKDRRNAELHSFYHCIFPPNVKSM